MVTHFTPLPPGLSPDTPHPSKLMYAGLASFGIIAAVAVSYLYFLTPPKGAVPLAMRKTPAMTEVASVVSTPTLAPMIATVSSVLVASPTATLAPVGSTSALLASPTAKLATTDASLTVTPQP